MKVLGLHFGHDAGIALVEDGALRFLAHGERLLREKHVSGLSYELVKDVLERANLNPADIDYCAITSTQGIDIVLDRSKPLTIDLKRHPADVIPSELEDLAQKSSPSSLAQIIDPATALDGHVQRRKKRITPIVDRLGIAQDDVQLVPCINRYLFPEQSAVTAFQGLRSLSQNYNTSLDELDAFRFAFNYPVTFTIDGCEIPASFVNHHAAHAAATFYQSPFDSSSIMTLDGGGGTNEGGLLWYGIGNKIIPLRMHYLLLGATYLFVAHRVLQLGGSAEGKLMGLAPYGEAKFFDELFVANQVDPVGQKDYPTQWLNHMVQRINTDEDRYNKKHLGVPESMMSAINADIAASTQKLFEETMIVAMEQFQSIVSYLDLPVDRICMSGGCMLNCPTNTRIFQESDFTDIYVEPACDDGGLPAGAALLAYFHLLDNTRTPEDPVKAGVPYLGLDQAGEASTQVLSKHASDIDVLRPDDVYAETARRLARGEVVGWYEGRSEVGPRALGHRSIVADPRSKDTWTRVNTIKGRELWRPLAPSVLEKHSADCFDGLPKSSPYMMFVGQLVRDDLPAITHVDGTSRIQTVSEETGGYYHMISAFHKLTGCPVVLNTSMNGPGEPIAEYPEDAIKMLLDGRFDALVLDGLLIERKQN